MRQLHNGSSAALVMAAALAVLFLGTNAQANCDYDVVGTTTQGPWTFSPDGQVTYGMQNWWEDDLYACYYSYLYPSYLSYFPGCDRDGSGAVDWTEVLDVYWFVVDHPTGGTPTYAYQCPTSGCIAGEGEPVLSSYDVGGPGTFGEPSEFTELDGLLYFRARFDGYGEELGAYDPVTDTAYMVADIATGEAGGSPYFLTAHGGKLYFRAGDDTWDTELFVYDPVADQVDKIDINPSGQSNPKELFSASDGLLYFNANISGNIELYTYNPANSQVNMYEIFPGADQYGNPNYSYPSYMVEYNGLIYMQAGGPEGKELYSFHMTTKQVQRLSNIATGYDYGRGRSSYPSHITVFNNEIFFNAAKDGALDQELWIYTPATGGLREIVIDYGLNLFQGALIPAGGGPTLLTPYNGKLYMRAQQVPVGVELFVYDPATDAVTLAFDSAPGINNRVCHSNIPNESCVLEGDQCEGISCTLLTYGNDGNTQHLTLKDGKFYYSAPFDNRELWYYDPATDQGGQLMEIYPGQDQWGNPAHGAPHGITVFDDKLFFEASDPSMDYEMFSVSWDCP